MKYTTTNVAGVTIVDLEPHHDHRGFFSRTFCAEEFARYGLDPVVAQVSMSQNRARGTLRGLHRQMAPHAEAKLVRCTRGAIADVAVDVRPESSTYGRHAMVELSASNHRSLFIPPYVAHGFQVLADDTEVLYLTSVPYVPGFEQGFRWNDPEFAIEWPMPVTAMSEKDALWPLLAPVR